MRKGEREGCLGTFFDASIVVAIDFTLTFEKRDVTTKLFFGLFVTKIGENFFFSVKYFFLRGILCGIRKLFFNVNLSQFFLPQGNIFFFNENF